MQAPEIILDFEALASNFEQLSIVGASTPRALFPVVKSNAYGLGADMVALELERRFDETRMPYVCVARWDEALRLRKAGLQREILVLSQYSLEDLLQNTDKKISLLVGSRGDFEILRQLNPEARGRIRSLHLDLDTGMNRLGLKLMKSGGDFANEDEVLRNLAALKIPVSGVSTHMARGEEDPGIFSDTQIESFSKTLNILKSKWSHYFDEKFPQWIHVSNSPASCRVKCDFETARRPGILLWGAYQDLRSRKEMESAYPELKIKPVLSMKACLRKTLWVEPGEGVSYGHRFVATRKTLIGVLSVGYADGVSRSLSRSAEQASSAPLKFWMDSFAVPIVGTVTMDMLMVDLTDHPRALEYVAKTQRGEAVWAWWICDQQPVEQHAEALGTISYEVLCGITSRVKRRSAK